MHIQSQPYVCVHVLCAAAGGAWARLSASLRLAQQRRRLRLPVLPSIAGATGPRAPIRVLPHVQAQHALYTHCLVVMPTAHNGPLPPSPPPLPLHRWSPRTSCAPVFHGLLLHRFMPTAHSTCTQSGPLQPRLSQKGPWDGPALLPSRSAASSVTLP